MSRTSPALSMMGLIWAFGCVSVHTPSTNVEVGPTNLFSGHEDESSDETPYAKTVKRITHQQTKLAKELSGGKWEDIIDESGEWVEQARRLGGYADRSYDPPVFRRMSEELVDRVESVYQAALSRHMAGCQKGMDASNVAINRFIDTFPLTHSEANAAAEAHRSRQRATPSSRQPTVP